MGVLRCYREHLERSRIVLRASGSFRVVSEDFRKVPEVFQRIIGGSEVFKGFHRYFRWTQRF